MPSSLLLRALGQAVAGSEGFHRRLCAGVRAGGDPGRYLATGG